ncbi:hypothetical protein [Maribacter aestuarii]|uniref:hypothetical protein n=1 Tax=Maribacter aestuarii TaxID=1130723 RepID=UPI00248C48EB|nr:hypothetical protein [Maribacter aestuarii]
MKSKFVFLCALFLASLGLQAQVDRTNFRAGINVGLVVGDFSEAYSLNLGLDVYQHWGVSREIDLGIATGFSNAFGEKQTVSNGGLTIETEFDNVQFIPIAGSLRIYPTSGFKIGGDVGYAVGINKGNEGGFYYRPTIGFDISGGTTEINVSYFAVNDEVTFSSALLGVLFLF